MRVVLIGGTGLVGTAVAQALVDRGDQVLCHTRKPRKNRAGIYYFTGSSNHSDTYQEAMSGADGVINLAGAPIACRWSASARSTILKSRVETTRALVQALTACNQRPRVWINASAVGFYGARTYELRDETAPLGSGFLAEVTSAWEAAALDVEALGPRLVRLRLGAVLAAHGGMLPLFVNAARAFVGGPLGTGDQPLSWIHLQDAVRMMLWALDEESATGAINGVAPNPTVHSAFVTQLGKVMGRPMWLRTPPWALQLVMGDMARELILGGQAVVPKVALQIGFSWRFPHLEGALQDLLTKR